MEDGLVFSGAKQSVPMKCLVANFSVMTSRQAAANRSKVLRSAWQYRFLRHLPDAGLLSGLVSGLGGVEIITSCVIALPRSTRSS